MVTVIRFLSLPNILTICRRAMNRDKSVYGPDADEFKPERFLNESGQLLPPLKDTHDEGHVTYGFGRR